MKIRAYSRVDRGLEDIVIRDLKEEHNIEAKKREMKGKIFYNATLDKIIELNLTAKSINRVILLLEETEIRNLEDIEKAIKKIDFTEYINRDHTFAIRANRIGKHSFTSLDIARVSGKALIDNYKDSTGKKLKVNLNNPDIEVVVEVIDNRVLIGIDTSGLSLHIRRYRVYNHPMPMKTTIAYLLIRIIEWDKKRKLIDPTCGGGTIPIEAAHYLRKIPICLFRPLTEFAMTKLPIFDNEKIREKCMEAINNIKEEKAPILGVEINQNIVKGAIENVKNAKVIDTVTIIHGDATELPKYAGGEVSYIVANPPYSLPNRKEIIAFYKKFINAIEETLEPEGKAAIITSEAKLMKKFLKETKLLTLHERTIPYGSLYVTIFKLVKED